MYQSPPQYRIEGPAPELAAQLARRDVDRWLLHGRDVRDWSCDTALCHSMIAVEHYGTGEDHATITYSVWCAIEHDRITRAPDPVAYSHNVMPPAVVT